MQIVIRIAALCCLLAVTGCNLFAPSLDRQGGAEMGELADPDLFEWPDALGAADSTTPRSDVAMPTPDMDAGSAADTGGTGDGGIDSGLPDPNTWVDLSVAGDHACALDSTGAAYCWGEGAHGKLGNGDTLDQALPVRVDSTVQFSVIAAGDEHTCALDVDGFVWCWGEDEHIGALSDQLVPFQPHQAQYKAIDAGHDAVCAIDLADQVKCWGENDSGQLGVVDNSVQVAPVDLSGAPFLALDVALGDEFTCALDLQGAATCFGRDMVAPPDDPNATRDLVQPITAGVAFVAIEASEADACGLTVDGDVHCWGNAPFVLVAGSSNTAASVSGALRVTDMALGDRFVCGLDADGALLCHGSNYRGRLGRGDDVSDPALFDDWGPVVTSQTFKKIALYDAFGCALTNDGQIMCWGSGHHGTMGNGNLGYVPEPQLVPSAETFSKVATGDYHSCALTSDGRTFCWGRGSYRALGLGDFEHQESPMQVATELFVDLEAAGSHTCGLTAAGDMWCWGSNSDGVLGIGNQNSRNVPTQTLTAEVVSAFTSGSDHACALYPAGTACWGDGSEVGMGNIADVNTPTLLDTINHPNYVAITSGNNHTCGLNAGGDAFCFGHNDEGELGNGTRTDALTIPVAINTAATFKEISAGDEATCGVTSADDGLCWGHGNMVGDGNTTRDTSPTALAGGHKWSTIVTGNSLSCGITLADEAFCWGASGLGQIGYGGLSRQNSPRQVTLPDPAAHLAPAGNHACAVTTVGEVYCWGSREFGRLGDGLDSIHRSPVYVSFEAP